MTPPPIPTEVAADPVPTIRAPVVEFVDTTLELTVAASEISRPDTLSDREELVMVPTAVALVSVSNTNPGNATGALIVPVTFKFPPMYTSLAMPAPPKVWIDPVEVLVLVVLSVWWNSPPTYRRLPIPTPPDTTNVPVDVLDASNVPATFKTPPTFASPYTPNPPPVRTSEPVEVDVDCALDDTYKLTKLVFADIYALFIYYICIIFYDVANSTTK
jgi:hypothetical protein